MVLEAPTTKSSSSTTTTKMSLPGTSTLQVLATSSSRTQRKVQERILAHKAIDGPLCQYRKGFFDHLKPRAFITGVRMYRCHTILNLSYCCS